MADKHPYKSQYLFEPDTEEQKAAKKAKFDEWCRTRNAFNIDNRIPYNMNGWDSKDPYTDAMKDECEIVHQYALRQVMLAPLDKAWETYIKVSQAYQKYLEKGIPASSDFDVKKLVLAP